MQKIVPFLWFDDNAEEAVNFYVSVFKNSTINHVRLNEDDRFGKKGTWFTASFQLEGQQFYALNGGPHHKFNWAVSLYVNCSDQAEVDALTARLTEDGKQLPCGWVEDRFGLAWQLIPTTLTEYLDDPDPAKVRRVMDAMLQMTKIDVADLTAAYSAIGG